jgi:hypothetical protein
MDHPRLIPFCERKLVAEKSKENFSAADACRDASRHVATMVRQAF